MTKKWWTKGRMIGIGSISIVGILFGSFAIRDFSQMKHATLKSDDLTNSLFATDAFKASVNTLLDENQKWDKVVAQDFSGDENLNSEITKVVTDSINETENKILVYDQSTATNKIYNDGKKDNDFNLDRVENLRAELKKQVEGNINTKFVNWLKYIATYSEIEINFSTSIDHVLTATENVLKWDKPDGTIYSRIEKIVFEIIKENNR